MVYCYPKESINKDKLNALLKTNKIEKVDYKEDSVLITSNLSNSELEKLIDSSIHYSTLRLKADIDCANCAREVAEGLEKEKHVLDADFNFQKKLLTVTTLLSKEEIMEKAKDIEE